MTETEQLADIIALSVHAATEPLLLKIAVLEARPVGYGTKEAWDALTETVSDLRTRLYGVEALAPIPGPQGPQGEPGAPGRPGLDGKDGAAGLNGKDGRDGLDGKDGAMGLPGKDGEPGLAGKDGRDGLDGKDGAPGLAGKDGANGLNGKDGISITNALQTKDGDLTLTFSDGTVRDVGRVKGEPGLNGKDGADGLSGKDGANGRDGLPGVPGRWGEKGEPGIDGKNGINGQNGKDGKDGLNGKDGIGLDAFDLAFDPHKGFEMVVTANGKKTPIPVPIPFDAGVWQAGRLYPKAAGVTVKGAFFIAQEPTRTRPDDGSPESAKAWRMAVKGGRDGKNGKDGINGKDWDDR